VTAAPSGLSAALAAAAARWGGSRGRRDGRRRQEQNHSGRRPLQGPLAAAAAVYRHQLGRAAEADASQAAAPATFCQCGRAAARQARGPQHFGRRERLPPEIALTNKHFCLHVISKNVSSLPKAGLGTNPNFGLQYVPRRTGSNQKRPCLNRAQHHECRSPSVIAAITSRTNQHTWFCKLLPDFLRRSPLITTPSHIIGPGNAVRVVIIQWMVAGRSPCAKEAGRDLQTFGHHKFAACSEARRWGSGSFCCEAVSPRSGGTDCGAQDEVRPLEPHRGWRHHEQEVTGAARRISSPLSADAMRTSAGKQSG